MMAVAGTLIIYSTLLSNSVSVQIDAIILLDPSSTDSKDRTMPCLW